MRGMNGWMGERGNGKGGGNKNEGKFEHVDGT